MHLSEGLLSGPVCPVTACVAAAGIGVAAVAARRAGPLPGAGRFAAVAALVFAGQMLNFPVAQGTSGHLLGGVLAAACLGVPCGVLAMAVVVTIQCLVFSDGAPSALGANLLNMAVLGTGLAGGWAMRAGGGGRTPARLARLAVAAWGSVVIAAGACAVELAAAGTVSLGRALPAMLGVHAVIGLAEAALTVGVVALLGMEFESARRRAPVGIIAGALGLVMASPWASPLPDGLEHVLARLGAWREAAPAFAGPLADYALPGVAHPVWSVLGAAWTGVGLVFAAAWVAGRALAGGRAVMTGADRV